MTTHSCKLHCHAMDPEQMESLNIKDHGKWLPYVFHMDIVIGCKLTSDDSDEPVYGCTTLFTEQGDSFIIDTPYVKFSEMFVSYHNSGNLPAAPVSDDIEL